MKAESILQADLLDIIFEQRNKAYGAYPLRKYYEERVYKALGIILIFLAVISVYSLVHKRPEVAGLSTTELFLGNVVPEVKQPKEDIPKPKQSIQAILKHSTSATHIKFVDSTQKSDPIINIDSSRIAGRPESGPTTTGIVLGGYKGPGDGGSPVGAAATVVPAKNRDNPVALVDIMPSFPGGMAALTKFLERNLQIPEELGEGSVVSVKVKFIVGYDGLLKSFEVVKDGGEIYNKEVIRVLKKMPLWIPGVAKGENVSVYYTIPVKFVLPE